MRIVSLKSCKGSLLNFFIFIFSALFTAFLIFSASFILFEIKPEFFKKVTIFSKLKYFSHNSAYIPDISLGFRRRSFLRHDAVVGSEFINHPVLGFHAKPVVYSASFDKDGFRPSSGTSPWKLAIIGDSFIEAGEHDDDTLSARINELSGWSVLNRGTSNWGPAQYMEVFKQQILAEKPVRVIMAFFEGNDIRDIGAYRDWLNRGRSGRYAYYGTSLFERFSYAFTDLLKAFKLLFHERVRVPVAKARGRYIDVAIRQSVDVKIPGSHFKDIFVYHSELRPVADLLSDSDWKYLRSLLNEFVLLSKSNGIKPYLLFVPNKQHIYAPLTTSASGVEWLNKKVSVLANLSNTENAIKQLSKELNLPLISLTPLFQQEALMGNRPFYIFDSHWNSHGRKVAAKFVVDKLSTDVTEESP